MCEELLWGGRFICPPAGVSSVSHLQLHLLSLSLSLSRLFMVVEVSVTHFCSVNSQLILFSSSFVFVRLAPFL